MTKKERELAVELFGLIQSAYSEVKFYAKSYDCKGPDCQSELEQAKEIMLKLLKK